jgi:AcrR family transcriptional regulator
MSSSKKPKDFSTEEKIKAAAKKLFTKKGFSATRTRDIAEEAGINLALLNYYFRSKQKLFEIVMRENILLFIGGMLENLNKRGKISFDEKLEMIVGNYIDMLIANPDLPFFILSISRSGHLDFEDEKEPIVQGIRQLRSSLFADLEVKMQNGKMKKIHPLHLIANVMGLVVFPFVASNILRARSGNISKTEFEKLMLERKKLIPIWVKSMFNA